VSGCIDPGHAVGEDGKRYLFFNGVRRIALTDDGLATAGELEQVYNPWRYPDDWVVEMFAAEGPKLLRRGDWFYLVAAVGGTSGPPTSHMVIVARSHSIMGPGRTARIIRSSIPKVLKNRGGRAAMLLLWRGRAGIGG
jgi:xylan 1,4-beta-xylosidase